MRKMLFKSVTHVARKKKNWAPLDTIRCSTTGYLHASLFFVICPCLQFESENVLLFSCDIFDFQRAPWRKKPIDPLEDLDSVVMPVGNNDSSILCKCHTPRKLEFTIWVTFAAKRGVKSAIRLEDLYSVVLKIAHYDESLGIYSDSPGTVQLAIIATFPAKTELEFPITVKLYDSVVFSIGYQTTVIVCHCHVVRTVELTVFVAMTTIRHDVGPIHLEELYSVVVFIGQQQVAVFGQS